MRMLRHIATAATLLIAAGAPAATRAADAAQQVLEEVIVVAKRLTPLQSAPATVSVIDQSVIARRLSQDVRQLVRYEPGVSVRNDPVRFGLDSFAIRGIGGDRVAAEVDGVAVAESFAIGALADSGRTFTDLDFIQRVEIMRGPASALYGSDAIGGVIRFQTVDPADFLEPPGTFASLARAGYRGDTDGWWASSLSAWAAGRAEMLLGYVHREDHEADIAGPLDPNPRDSRSDQVLAKWVLPDIAAGPLEVALEAGRTRDATIVSSLLGVPPRFTNTVAMNGHDTAEHARVGVEQSVHVDNAWIDDAVWRLHVQHTQSEQITDEERRAVPPRSPPTRLQRSFTLEDRLAGAEVTFTKAIPSGTWRHQVVYGVELEAGRVTEQRDGSERNLNTGTVTPVILGEVFPVRDFPVTDRAEAGIYLQDDVTREGSRWHFTPGLRFDWYRLRPREDDVYREDNPSARPVALDDQAIAPKMALSYEVTQDTTAFGQYARGFRAPPFEDVNIGLEIPLFNYRALPNPDLRPETSDSLEIGLRSHGSAWRTTLSAYYTRFEDFIESRANVGTDPLTGATLFQSRNIASARMYGVELASHLDAGALLPSLPGWSLGLNASWARGDDTVSDQPLNSIEPAQVNLIVEYAAPNRWGAQLIASATAAKDRVAEGTAPLYRSGSHLVLDAFAYATLGARGQINLGVTNLTDEHSIDWVDVRGRLASDPLVPYAAHPGRSLSLSVRWELP
jgi:hemoglobin/transferrin/lactoferrin receptor protein